MSEPLITLTIPGQIRGGKNNMKISFNGRHYPDPKWAAWRDEIVQKLVCQKNGMDKLTYPLSLEVHYTPEDERRRDIPAVLDSIFHCLERASVVADDALIHDLVFKRYPKSKESAGAVLKLSYKS